MQTFIESNDFVSFVATHGDTKAAEKLTAFIRGTEKASDIHDKMCNALSTREGYTVDLIENRFAVPAVDMVVSHAGAYDVYVHFVNTPARVKAVDTTRFIDGATGRGVHGVYVGEEIIGRRDLEIEKLPNGRLVAFVSRSRMDVEAIRDIVVLLQRIGGKPPRARAAPAAAASAATASTSSGDVRVFKCDVCDKVFKNACGLANHMRHKHKEVAAAAATAVVTPEVMAAAAPADAAPEAAVVVVPETPVAVLPDVAVAAMIETDSV